VGFVFAPSKRRVTVEQVAQITTHLPAALTKIGVFVTTDAEEILDTASRAGLTDIQLHSAFDPALVEAIDAGSGGTLRVVQVVDIDSEIKPGDLHGTLKQALMHPYVVAALLDTSHGGASGGTGKTFDWEGMAAMVRDVLRETEGRVIVAGGLNAENVADAIERLRPWGVDVASGVEAVPGKKDPERLRTFLKAAREAASKLEV
jgi:phosphoribosylanthranilate isomerase